MIRFGLWTLALMGFTAFAVPGCGIEANGLGEETADEEVNLESMLSVAGAADITHGTQAYRAPAGAPQHEQEERCSSPSCQVGVAGAYAPGPASHGSEMQPTG